MKLDTPTYTLKNICPLAYLIPACDISQKTQRKNDVPEYVIDHGILNYTSFFNLLQTIKLDVIICYNANGLRFFCISSMQSYSFYRTKCGQLRFLFCPVIFFFRSQFSGFPFFLTGWISRHHVASLQKTIFASLSTFFSVFFRQIFSFDIIFVTNN